jgi:8-oxo-dGTP diphosphatase
MTDGEMRLACGKCMWVHYENPLPSVAALLRNEKGDILLVKRGVVPGKGKWALPTGFIEQHEHPEEAVVRELKEETNITGRPKRLIGVYSEKTPTYGNIILVGYEMEYVSGTEKPGSDTVQAQFFPMKRLPQIPFRSHRAVIRDEQQSPFAGYIEVLKSKITEATITHTQLYYRGSMGIDSAIMKAVNLIPGEKVHVLNYDNGERLETYTISEKAGSGKIVLYGPAARKGKPGNKLCILSYTLVPFNRSREIKPSILVLNERNKPKRKPT